jgi:YD repeat-containing protein
VVQVKNQFFFKFFILSISLTVQLTFALQGGPAQPDYMQFEPSTVTDMVNPQTGNFTYSIPLGELPGPYGGYPLSISYHAGISPQSEASWVGLGWFLNPGSINRDVRGVPDDQFHGGTLGYVYQYSGMKTWVLDVGLSTSGFSVGIVAPSTGEVGFTATVGVKLSETAQVGFTVGNRATGFSMRFGKENGPNLDASMMMATNGSSRTYGLRLLRSNNDVAASAGAQYTTGQGASANVGFGSRDGLNHVGMTVSSEGITARAEYGCLQAGRTGSGSSVSVGGGELSVSNAKNKGNTKTTTIGFNIIIPAEAVTFSLGFSQSLHEYHMRSATSDYVYGYMYQAGPAIIVDDSVSRGANMPMAAIARAKSHSGIPWKWTLKGRTLEALGDNEMYPAYDLYNVASEGVSGTFRPFTREKHILHQIISNIASSDSTTLVDYSTITVDSADGSPYIGEFRKNEDGTNVLRGDSIYPSYNQCIHSDKCTPYAIYATQFRNEGNRLVYRRNKEDVDTLTSGIRFLFAGEGGFYKSEPYGNARTRPSGDVWDGLLKRNVGGRDFALYGSRKIEPIFEDESPVGKLEGFVITNSDGTKYYFQQPVKSYLKVDYSINQEKGVPLFVDLKGDVDKDFVDNLKDGFGEVLKFVAKTIAMPWETTYDILFAKGELDEKCKEKNKEGELPPMYYTYQVNMNPYATQWLLTEIRGADYVELDTSISKNIGYNVKFKYTKPSIYRWRTPFARPGLVASDLPNFRMPRNGYTPEGCDSRMYQASFGAKEMVYLESIETATHKVQFKLNDEERVDGKGWEFDHDGKAKTLPLFAQASVAFDADYRESDELNCYKCKLPLNIMNCSEYSRNYHKYRLRPKWIYTNVKIPPVFLKNMINGDSLSITGFNGKLKEEYCPTSITDIPASFFAPNEKEKLYGMPYNLKVAIDSNSEFIETTGEEAQYGLYKIRVHAAWDTAYIFEDSVPSFDDSLVVGENGYVNNVLAINWNEIAFAHDTSDAFENQMRYLEKISYYNKNDTTPYKEFSFDYDYSLHPKTLNSYCKGHYPQNNDQIKDSPDSVGVDICEGNTQNHLYGKLTLKSITEKGCQYGKCASLPPFTFEYHSPSLTSTRLSTKEGWKNLSQSITFATEDDTLTNQFPESYFDSITEVDASIIASSNAIDEWGFWNDRGVADNHKVRQAFADYGASAWSLSRVKDPTGGILDIDYERDVYANGEDNSNDNMYVHFVSADTCKNYKDDYSIHDDDAEAICIELGPLYWREQCLGPRVAFWDTVRPAGYIGNGFEYLDTLRLRKNGQLDTSVSVFYNVLGHMRTEVDCGFLGIGSCDRNRAVAVLGDGKPQKLLDNNSSDKKRKLLVLDMPMAYMSAGLDDAARKINSKQEWAIKSREGSIWVKDSIANMKGGDLRVKRLTKRDIDRTVKTEYEYEAGEIAQLPDSAFNSVLGNRFYGSKVSSALPDMKLTPKSRIVGFDDHDIFFIPGASITYPKVTIKNSSSDGLVANGKTVFEYITPETGIPEDYIDDDTRAQLIPFLRINTRVFAWGGNTNDATYAERPFLVIFNLLDANRNVIGSEKRMMVLRDGVTSLTFYDHNIRNAKYLAATSRFSMDKSLSVQYDTLALGDSLTNFNDMAVSILWYLGDIKSDGWLFLKERYAFIKNNQQFSLHKLWSRSQKDGYYPILYKMIEYAKEPITLPEMDGEEQAEQDQKDTADFERMVTYFDFTSFLGLNTKTTFFRGNDVNAIPISIDSNVYSTMVPDVAKDVANNSPEIAGRKMGQQIESWGYDRVLICKDYNNVCQKQNIALYDRDTRTDPKNFQYIRFPAFQIKTIQHTGYDNQKAENRDQWSTAILENHYYDPLTGAPTATLARTPAKDGKEMRKLTLKRPHYSLISGDTSIANEMFRRNMFMQNYLDALYSGIADSSAAWNSIENKDSLRSFAISPYKFLPISNRPSQKQALVAWGEFKSRNEPKQIIGSSDLNTVVGNFQNANVAPDINNFEGARTETVDTHFRITETKDELGRTVSSHYSKDGNILTGIFFPAKLSETASVVPAGDSVANKNCTLDSTNYKVTEKMAIQALGNMSIACSVSASSSGTKFVAEYSVKRKHGSWETVRDTNVTSFNWSLNSDDQLGYLRVYPQKAQAKTFVYDKYGNLVRIVSEENLSTYYEYNPFGHLVQMRDDDGVSFKVHHREYRNKFDSVNKETEAK